VIRQVEIEGFRSVRALRMRLDAATVVVGENGTGKTSLYRALQLFQAAAAGTLARTIAEDGGMHRPLEAHELSDGTLRYLCLVAALLSPRPPQLLALDEPETSLHPDLLGPLAEQIAAFPRGLQV
jgi:predicted ATPase